MTRRVAAHIVNVAGQSHRQALVEIEDGEVVAWRTFTDEQPMTEWLGGTIDIVEDTNGTLRALHTPTINTDEQSRRTAPQEEPHTDTQQEGRVRVLLR